MGYLIAHTVKGGSCSEVKRYSGTETDQGYYELWIPGFQLGHIYSREKASLRDHASALATCAMLSRSFCYTLSCCSFSKCLNLSVTQATF